MAVAGYSIETPRLLLNSSSRRFPDGMCNDEDQVGRYLMVQGAPQVPGRFEQEVRAYKAPPPEVSTEAFYQTDPHKPYVRGFSRRSVSPLPITYAEHVSAEGHWGRACTTTCGTTCTGRCSVRCATSSLLAENRVTLADEKDAHGLPLPGSTTRSATTTGP